MNFPNKTQQCRFDILTPFAAHGLTGEGREIPTKTKNPAKAGFF